MGDGVSGVGVLATVGEGVAVAVGTVVATGATVGVAVGVAVAVGAGAVVAVAAGGFVGGSWVGSVVCEHAMAMAHNANAANTANLEADGLTAAGQLTSRRSLRFHLRMRL